jgi:energy-coupling factor transport system permease protein
MSGEIRSLRPHPIAVALLAVPALVAVLVDDEPWFGLVAVGCCAVVALGKGIRFAVAVVVGAVVTFGLLRLWMGLWLPADPATTGALRITAMGALLVVPFAFVRWQVLGDTLVAYCRVPYRVMDAAALGERFATLMRADLRAIAHAATLRSRGGIRRRAAILLRATVPVLVAAFRHGDELAVAMDARGFGARPSRTMRWARPVRASDGLLVLAAWSLTVVTAVLL